MSQRNLNSLYQNLEKSENQRWCLGARSTPIACIVCERVFYNNVSLLLHFECHLNQENPIPRQHGRDLASLQSRNRFPLTPSPYPYSSAQRITGAQNVVLPRMNNRFRPRPLPVSSAITPNLTARDANLAPYPVLNSMPPIHHSMMSPYGATPSTHPLIYSQSGTRSFAYGSAPAPAPATATAPAPAPAPRLQIRVENGGQARLSNRRNHRTNPLGNSMVDVIVISDDEEDNKENAAEMDLTLKL